jgi:cytochrome P450 / NADPH-cytochrome P450 reductase
METIPQPKPHLLIGNVPELVAEATTVEALMRLAREYGPIYRVQVPGYEMIVVSFPGTGSRAVR